MTIKIDTKYAGGNVKVVDIEETHITLEQDLRDSTTWWFYWNFFVQSSQSKKIVFEFTNGEVIGPWGPAVSKDGVTWEWLGKKSVISNESFFYDFPEGDHRVYFSFSMPYQLHHFENFYEHIQRSPLVNRQILALSEQLRPIPLLTIGNPNAEQDIIFTCRHHACESTPSYMLEGLLTYLLDHASSNILEDYLIHYIPFVDMDGVENGDQGKNRHPHDHNRDYIQSPIYQSTAAIMEYVKSLNLMIGIDFHGPYKWGERNDHPFFVKQFSPIKEEIEKLSKCLEQVTAKHRSNDKISYSHVHDIEMGVDWNQPHGKNGSAFFQRQHAKLACTFEFPYFGTEEMMITQQSCRQFGNDFARALEKYLYSIKSK